MGQMQISFFGRALVKQCQMMVCFPDRIEYPGPYSVMLLLHGLSDDHTAWTRYTSIERHAARLPLLVVMPDGHRSFYTDAAGEEGDRGQAYRRHLVEDVLGTVDRFFRTRPGRAGRCVSGLSMGGYGAIKLALRHPDLFASATGHSGAYAVTRPTPLREDLSPELRRIFGTNVGAGGEDDCFALAERADPKALPALRFDCGVDDFLIETNREFHRHLTRLGVAHEYEEHPGAHTWDYWDRHIQDSIAFHARHLGLETA